jgi:hypothetical protein
VRKLILCLFVVMSASVSAMTQVTTEPCPAGLVCITPEAARKALLDSDTVKAQSVNLAVKDTVIADLRKHLDDMRLEFVRADTKATALEKQAIRDAAIIELLLKMVRAKKIGLLNF